MRARALLVLLVALPACPDFSGLSRCVEAKCGARSTLTLDRMSPTSPLASFPVPIFLDDTRAAPALLTPETFHARSGSTELPVEIDSLGPPFVAWILVPQIAGTTTEITIEYGADIAARTPVWDASYAGVWHMTADGRDAGSFARASTANALTEINGVLGRASAYTPAQHSCIVVPSLTSYAFTNVTLSGWIRLNRSATTADFYTIMTRQLDDLTTDDFIIGTRPPITAFGNVATDMTNPTRVGSALASDVWHHVAYVYDFANHASALYVDGAVLDAGAASGLPMASARPAFIGCGRNGSVLPVDQPDGDYVDGALDEVRLETTARSAAWIGYEYASSLDQVITYGPVEYFDVAPVDDTPVTIRVQAESGTATGSGVSVRTELVGYEGAGYVGDFTNAGDTLAVRFPNVVAGIYNLKIRYHAWTPQQNDLAINDASRSQPFAATDSNWAVLTIPGVALPAGASTITIRKDWGYIDVDWIEIAP